MLLLKELGDNRDVALGVLVMRNIRPAGDDNALAQAKKSLEQALRDRYGALTRAELKALHPMDMFVAYYKKHRDTYHVLPQLESILRGREIPEVLPPVTAMFMAELKNMLLTSGHDLALVQQPMRLEMTTGQDPMTSLGGKELLTIPGDFMVTDEAGVLSAILRGADARTAINEKTRDVVYTVYAPAGVENDTVISHLDDIEAYVRLFAPDVVTEEKGIY
jgi:DNA/RNA-binding domain of Phe-tRNA-synthetase-like protein